MMDYQRLIPVVEEALALSRRTWDKPTAISDDYFAWVILNEIRRAGFAIAPKDGSPQA
jgi:hypothetical protein